MFIVKRKVRINTTFCGNSIKHGNPESKQRTKKIKKLHFN